MDRAAGETAVGCLAAAPRRDVAEDCSSDGAPDFNVAAPSNRSFDAQALVGSWQSLPSSHWELLHAKFDIFLHKNGAHLSLQARTRWDLHPIPFAGGSGVQVFVGFGDFLLMHRFGRILRRGVDRFADQYRVRFSDGGEIWDDVWRCSLNQQLPVGGKCCATVHYSKPFYQ